MNCTKCGKKNPKVQETMNNGEQIKCSKCSLLCSTINCKKKIFKFGCCSLHVIIVNERKERFKGRGITEEDIKRREMKHGEDDMYHRYLRQQTLLINDYCQQMSKDNISNGKEILRELKDGLQEIINARNETLDSSLKETKQQTIVAFEENIIKMFDNGDCISGLKFAYQEYRGRFKEYKEHFDNHRQKKQKQEQRKAERTSRRDYERSERNKERSNNNSGSWNHSQSSDDSDNEPDLEDEETYFKRTSGPSILRDAFEMLEIIHTNDYDIVRKAYKKAALKNHPDKHPGEEAQYNVKFLDITQAYELICTKLFKTRM